MFTKRRLDDEALEELEELLISADLGTAAASRVIAGFRRSRFGKEVTDDRDQTGAGGGNFRDSTARGLAAGAEPGVEAACRAGGWRQRHRQDHHDRQAGAEFS